MSYTAAVFYVDDGLASGTPGSNAARATLTAVVFDNPSTTIVRGTKVAHGLITGMVVTITGTTNWNGEWMVTHLDVNTFTLDGAVWASGADNIGDVIPNGGSSWVDAWLTNLRGGAQGQLGAGSEVRYARSPAPASVGVAAWTGGVREAQKNIVSTTNTTPIVLTITGHLWGNGDWLFINDHTVNTAANGLWRVANKTADTVELEGSVGNGVGGATGVARRVSTSVVYLAAAQTANIHNCDSGWIARSGLVVDMFGTLGYDTLTVDGAGLGYTANDVLTIMGGGGTGATLKVLSVGGGGEVQDVEILTHGSGYAVGAGNATTGGTGNGLCTVNIVYSATVETGSGEYWKQGRDSFRVNLISILPGTPLAHAPTSGALNLSAYQKISFQAGVALNQLGGSGSGANDWEICLCSDTGGVTPVDVFKLPSIDNTNSYLRLRPLVLTKEGGGNLGASIQSVLVRAGAAPSGTQTKLTLDNIVACTTSGLNHQSLISKNSAEQGGAEPWHAIAAIDSAGLAVVIETTPGTGARDALWAPYYGATESVMTYIRQAIKVPYAVSGGVAADLGNTWGTEALPTNYTGGWNVSTGLRTGETFYDGLSGEGNGVDCGGQRWVNVVGFGAYRFLRGWENAYDMTNAACNYNISAASHCENGVMFTGYGCTLSILNARNNGTAGLNLELALRCKVNGAVLISSGLSNLDIGGYSHRNEFRNLVVKASRNIGILSRGTDNVIYGLVSADNADAVVACIAGRLLFYELLEANVADFAIFTALVGLTGLDACIHSFNHNASGQDRLWFEQASGRSLPTTRTGGVGKMWELALDGVYAFLRDGAYPVRYGEVHVVAVKANKLVTLRAWMQKNSATNVRGRLVVRGGQLPGVDADVVATLADSTDWQELVVTFTPTAAGWIEAEVWGDYVSGSGVVVVDDVSSTQAA